MYETYVGADTGVYRLTNGSIEPLGLDNLRISAIHAGRDARGETYILAGSYGAGLFRSADGGRSWENVLDGLPVPAFRTIGVHPLDPDALICGSEPARIFTSRDEGRSWTELGGVQEIDGYREWYLPYSPRAGAVRNVFAPDSAGERLFASVEVGGLLESNDRGTTWTCSQVTVDDDIHHITGHPDDPNYLFASLGYAALRSRNRQANGSGQPRLGGIGRSRDGGATWEKLLTDYTRATIIPPTHRDLVLAGPAPYVGREGRIVVSSDGGDSWEPAGDGIDTPMEDMVELFVTAPDDTIWAICSGGRLLKADAGEWHWRSALPAGTSLDVQAASFLS